MLTDKTGRFGIKDVQPGDYKFKVTKDGFQSVVGQISVKPGIKAKPIQIELLYGV